MQVELEGIEELRYADGTPVRAASAIVPWGDGFLVVPDDGTHGAWFRDGATSPVRLLPPVDGLDLFDEASGTKHLKPDLEAACPVSVAGRPAALLMGSGSSPARMRWVLLREEGTAVAADLSDLYPVVAEALAVPPDVLNLEGACLVGGRLRWFHRGLPAAGFPSGSVDLDPGTAVAAVLGQVPAGAVAVTDATTYDLGGVASAALAITDAVALPEGAVLLSTAAEDSPNVRDDGRVVASALVRLGSDGARDVVPLPLVDGRVAKVEGLMLVGADDQEVRLVAVVDVDDPLVPSLALRVRLR